MLCIVGTAWGGGRGGEPRVVLLDLSKPARNTTLEVGFLAAGSVAIDQTHERDGLREREEGGGGSW